MLIDFMSGLHRRTSRDYVARVNETPKAEAAEVAKRFGEAYWDGDRRFGYGGYHYDGRWRSVADRMRDHYGLEAGDRVLDVGCGKGWLLFDLLESVPGLEVYGLDISAYALSHGRPETAGRFALGHARALPFPTDSFDFVISINTLHNLTCDDLESALCEIERVGRRDKYVCVESYRNEQEKVNLLYWQLTCEAFNSPREWEWWFRHSGYEGDHSFIFLE